MRRITMLAMVALLALTGAGCGDDDDSGSDEPEATDDGGDTGDAASDDGSTDGAAGLLDEDCEFLLAADFNPLAALGTGTLSDELDETSEQLEAIADEAPDEIHDAMEVLVEGYAEMIDAVGDVDLSDPQSLADADVRERLDELEDVFDETYEEAAQEVSDYIAENCTAD